MAERKFGGLKGNPYASVAAVETEKPEAQQPEDKKRYYRFNLKLPIECKEYLQEMTWRTRSDSITAYLTALIERDMEQHPEWRENVDELNA